MKHIKQTLLICCFALIAALPAMAAEPGSLKNSERGVTVEVTPSTLAENAKTWEFKIVLDTHSQDLNDDLMKSSTLLDAGGAQHPPRQLGGRGSRRTPPRGSVEIQADLAASASD